MNSHESSSIIKNKFSFWTIFFLILIFRFAIDFGYEDFVVAIFDYDGFKYEFDNVRYIFSFFMIFISYYLWSKKIGSVLAYTYFVIYIVALIPASSYYAIGDANSNSFFFNVLAYCILVLFLPSGHSRSNKSNDKFINNININMYFIMFCWFFLFICILGLYFNNQGKFVLSFDDVYEFREDNQLTGVLSYLFSWSVKVVAPFLLAYALIRKGFWSWKTALSILVIILLFTLTGHKSVLVPIGFCLSLYYIFGGSRANIKPITYNRMYIGFTIAMLSFVSLVYAYYIIYDNIMIPSIFLRRAMFTPPFLNSIYFDMFYEYPRVYWSNSILSPFINYPYFDTLTHEVGAYLGRYGMGANTGFVGSGYAHAGYLGISIYIGIMLFCNWFVSLFGKNVSPVLFNSVILMPYLTLFLSSDLPTTFFTHGIIFSSLIIMSISGKLHFNSKK
ncbi:O-antigen polymerase [Acinetobacter sp. 1000160]|uniref:O-antigen polymerase n=1 Tax=Acinetobacter sp. 1000160 TaxID=1310800 RepID=UPI00044B7919|nr:O-antigen polymerase [Acinetobacter sp. 1000160]EXB45642.1 putative membrane protein [Acinetobacter baumannii 146457]EYT16395.1 putative membrane protein [Acinetobacter sp. 1000160]